MSEDQGEKDQSWYEKYKSRNERRWGERPKTARERLEAQYEEENKLKAEEAEKARKIKELQEKEAAEVKAKDEPTPKVEETEPPVNKISDELRARLDAQRSVIDKIKNAPAPDPEPPIPIHTEPEKTPYQKAAEWMKQQREKYAQRKREQQRANMTPLDYEGKPDIDNNDNEAVS